MTGKPSKFPWKRRSLPSDGDAAGGIHAARPQAKVNCYPASSSDVMAPQEATLFFLNITRLTSEALSLDMSTEVGKAFSGFKEIVTPAGEASVR